MNARVCGTRVTDKGIRLLESEPVYVGIDVHKKDYKVALWSEARQDVVSAWVQPADSAALCARLAPHGAQIAGVFYEAGPTGYELARGLRACGLRAEVIAPSHTPTATGQEAKSDRLDARRLSMYGAKGLLRAVRVPTQEEEADRQTLRVRQQMIAKRRRAMQQIRSFLLQHGLPAARQLRGWSAQSIQMLRDLALAPQLRHTLDCLLDDLAHFDAQVKRTTEVVSSVCRSARHGQAIRAMMTTPGVGILTAAAVRMELLGPERFEDAREVAAMMSLAPHVSATGQTRHEGRLMQTGNRRLRTALIEAAWRWVARDPWARERFRRLMATTASGKKAIVAMARRLGIILWRISVTGQHYQARPAETPAQDQAQACA